MFVNIYLSEEDKIYEGYCVEKIIYGRFKGRGWSGNKFLLTFLALFTFIWDFIIVNN
jgi:hypothetical protein